VRIELCRNPEKGGNTKEQATEQPAYSINPDGEQQDGDEEEEEASDLMFRVILEDAQPSAVKLSRKNVAFVRIVENDDEDNEAEQHKKLLEYYLSTKDPTWGDQFMNAICLGPTIEDDMEIDHVEMSEAIMHFIGIFWKVLFATVPPVKWYGGWAAFIVALTYIGAITAVVGQYASMFGCVIGMPDSVTAITFVALGTSLPDTFASMTAAKTSPNADSAIGNITGSNSVNVFLGLGLPWVIASTYQENRGNWHKTPPGDLSYTVAVYLSVSVVAFGILAARRWFVGGELGGPRATAYASSGALVTLWMIYITLSIINASNSKGLPKSDKYFDPPGPITSTS